MRMKRVPAKRDPAGAHAEFSWRWAETLGIVLVGCILAAGFRQVYRAGVPALDEASRRLAAGETMLLRGGAAAAEVAPFLSRYQDERQRGFTASRIAAALAHGAPANVGALASIRITRAEAERAGVAGSYAARFDRAGAAPIRLFGYDEFARLKPSFAVRTPEQFRAVFRNRLFLFFGVFVLAHLVLGAIGFRGDRWLLPLAFFLSGTGMILMVSLRDPVRDLMLFADFAGGTAVACALFAAIAAASHFMDLRSRGTLARLGRTGAALDAANHAARAIAKRGDLAFSAAIGLSILLLLLGTGPGESGARVRLWFFQPVEIVRFLLVLFLAGYFGRRWEFLRELKEKRVRTRFNLPRLDHAAPVMAAVAIAIAFFFLQKDLGPAVILAGLFLSLYAVARARAGLVAAAFAALAGAGWLAYTIGYPPVAVTRIGMWLRPWNNGLVHGEQVVHGLWAMASGGLFGTGLGLGQPQLIPAAHTDLILAALAEEAGFAGLVIVLAAFGLLFWRAFRIALRAATDYAFFLALGLALALALEGAFIAGGIAGILPLSGVVTPFLSYGATAMIVNFACLGVLLAISAKPGRPAPDPRFTRPVRILAGVLITVATLVVIKAGWVQIVKADEIAAAGTLVVREDGSYALAYNPRLVAVAHWIPRGTVRDRNGLPLATASWEEIEKHRAEYAALGIDIERACSRDDSRHYPFGAVMFHLLGNASTRERWAASNTAFEEKVSRARLQGFHDGESVETMALPRSGEKVRVLRYDYSELVPLLRARMDPSNEAVRKLMEAPRDVSLSIDARLQMRLTRAFQEYLQKNGWRTGAVVVIHPVSGELLASVSVPLPPDDDAGGVQPASLDLARFGEFPPGSAFKLVTAIAALRRDPALASKRYECVRLPDGRVGSRVRGRIIRDDLQDKTPHGSIDLRAALVHSCNGFFSQLGTYDVGAESLLATAQLFNIDVARPNTAGNLDADLPQAAYGQAQVLVTPLRLARVAGAIAAGGRLAPLCTRIAPAENAGTSRTILDPALAQSLQTALRLAVTSGTGRAAAASPETIAGKTGTAEVAKAPSHAWFAGYAPADGPADQRIAFAILVANGRYGGRAAAPFAPVLVNTARECMHPRTRGRAGDSK